MGDGAKARGVYEDAVEYLCRNVEELRPLVSSAVWESAFPVVRDADPAGAEWRDAVRALHDAVESAGCPKRARTARHHGRRRLARRPHPAVGGLGLPHEPLRPGRTARRGGDRHTDL